MYLRFKGLRERKCCLCSVTLLEVSLPQYLSTISDCLYPSCITFSHPCRKFGLMFQLHLRPLPTGLQLCMLTVQCLWADETARQKTCHCSQRLRKALRSHTLHNRGWRARDCFRIYMRFGFTLFLFQYSIIWFALYLTLVLQLMLMGSYIWCSQLWVYQWCQHQMVSSKDGLLYMNVSFVVGLVSREPRLRRYGREFRRNYGGLEDLFTQVLMRFQLSCIGYT